MSDHVYLVQIGLAVLILGLFWAVNKTYPLKGTTKTLALGAMFVMLSVGLSFFSMMLPVLGFPALKIGFSTIPLVIAGLLLNPMMAMLVGLVTDVVGLLLVPTNFPFFGFTLNTILWCLIPSLFMQARKHFTKQQMMRALLGFLVVLFVILGGYILWMNEIEFNKNLIALTPTIKAWVIGNLFVVEAGIYAVVHFTQKRTQEGTSHDLGFVVLTVLVLEVLITLILTPLWLNLMYGIPYFLSLFVRVLKAIVMIPLSIALVYSLFKGLKRLV
ncbi:MAG: folate family ECF transporter S component [Erysipelotrichaceae bacterium]